MSYEIRGKVCREPVRVSGAGQNGPWTRTTVVIEVPDGNYTSNVCLECSNNKAEEFSRLRVGDVINAKFSVSSREYQGKWYTSAKCFGWTLEGSQEAAAQPTPSAPAAPAQEAAVPTAENAEGKKDDLPFSE